MFPMRWSKRRTKDASSSELVVRKRYTYTHSCTRLFNVVSDKEKKSLH